MELIGSKIGRYKVEKSLGTGAQATVYLCTDTGPIKRKSALKVAHKELGGGGSTTLLNYRIIRFVREAAIAGQFSHPNIVTVYEYGQDKGIHFISMEYIEGFALSKLVKTVKGLRERKKKARVSTQVMKLERRSRIPIIGKFFQRARGPLSNFDEEEIEHITTVCDLIIQSCEALHAIHSKGIIHRDIKPGNILWCEGTKNIKITDFGIAKVVNQELKAVLGNVINDPLAKYQSNMTTEGDVLGTPMYMSPEQMVGNHSKLDHRSDLYSMGAVLFQLLTGKSPLEANTNGTNPGIPEELNAIVCKSMAKDSADRFQTGQEFASAIRTAKENIIAEWQKKPEKIWSLPVVKWTYRAVVALLIVWLLIQNGLNSRQKPVPEEVVVEVTKPTENHGNGQNQTTRPVIANPLPPESPKEPIQVNQPMVIHNQDTPGNTERPEPKAPPEKPLEPKEKNREREGNGAESKAQGALVIETNVPNLQIKVDGDNKGSTGRADKKIKLPPGNYTVELVDFALGISERERITIAPGKTSTVSKNFFGQLKVKTNTADCNIIVDGKNMGKTSNGTQTLRIPAGEHFIEILNPGLNIEYQSPLTIKPNGTQQIGQDFKGIYRLQLQIPVTAKMDGKLVNNKASTEIVFRGNPGSHTITLENPIKLRRPFQMEIMIKAGHEQVKLLTTSELLAGQ